MSHVIVSNPGRLLKVFRDDAGRYSYGVPSSCRAGVYYRCDANACACPSAQYRPWKVCRHMEAARDFEAREALVS
ncbi:MAG TPA: hypothetical protein VFB50_07590 [Chloroflexota bacterium]|nr:hypothetical protein [Chloroflexota bacterium]